MGVRQHDREYKIAKSHPSQQAIVLNFGANKKQITLMIVDQLHAFQIPHENRIVVTGPEPHPIQVGIGEWQTPI